MALKGVPVVRVPLAPQSQASVHWSASEASRTRLPTVAAWQLSLVEGVDEQRERS